MQFRVATDLTNIVADIFLNGSRSLLYGLAAGCSSGASVRRWLPAFGVLGDVVKCSAGECRMGSAIRRAQSQHLLRSF